VKIAAYKKRVPLDRLTPEQRERYERHLEAVRREEKKLRFAREPRRRAYLEKRRLYLQKQWAARAGGGLQWYK
jgi:hypothetical protein